MTDLPPPANTPRDIFRVPNLQGTPLWYSPGEKKIYTQHGVTVPLDDSIQRNEILAFITQLGEEESKDREFLTALRDELSRHAAAVHEKDTRDSQEKHAIADALQALNSRLAQFESGAALKPALEQLHSESAQAHGEAMQGLQGLAEVARTAQEARDTALRTQAGLDDLRRSVNTQAGLYGTDVRLAG